ncbi:MAG: hypothetical protein H6Q35_1052 [Proteobacteria bacterium]|nr:hypothetical protein [Pseudomonadota bacterium]
METSDIANVRARDYDKEPIIIEDYNPLFMWLSFIYVLFPLLTLFFIVAILYFPNKSFDFSKLLIFILIASWPAYNQYKNTKGKRKIFLNKNKISYQHDNQLITEIYFDKSPSFFRSFQNFYHKSQSRLKIWHLALIFLMGILITQSLILNIFIFLFAFWFAFLALQIIKLVIHIGEYRFYHALLVILDNEVISIPLLKQDVYTEVEEYFSKHNIHIGSLPKFHKFIYGYENIDIKQGK